MQWPITIPGPFGAVVEEHEIAIQATSSHGRAHELCDSLNAFTELRSLRLRQAAS